MQSPPVCRLRRLLVGCGGEIPVDTGFCPDCACSPLHTLMSLRLIHGDAHMECTAGTSLSAASVQADAVEVHLRVRHLPS